MKTLEEDGGKFTGVRRSVRFQITLCKYSYRNILIFNQAVNKSTFCNFLGANLDGDECIHILHICN